MNEKPILSIVTPTLGKFSDYWFEQLLKVQGSVQFVLVYPPGGTIKQIDDPRVKIITSPYKGEVMQRFTGLLNASGEYVLALDDDDFVHPDVVNIVNDYFQRFPQSWVLRLKSLSINYLNEERIKQDWASLPDMATIETSKKYRKDEDCFLLEIPIAPLDKKFNIKHAIWPFTKRTDQHGIHIENFNNKVWKNELVQEALPELSVAMKLTGYVTWIPSWNLDRSLGLFVQAKSYEKDRIVGHWMPSPEQIRYIYNDSPNKEVRDHLGADALLLKQFPQYGYFWNLFFAQVYYVPKMMAIILKSNLFKKG